jgi:hypothetical protein
LFFTQSDMKKYRMLICLVRLLKSLLTSRRMRRVTGTTRRYGIYGNELGFV